jgi:tellurite resistance protein
VASLTGSVGPLALTFFGYAAMLVFVFATMIPEFRRAPFAMSWWGWTFPTGAFTVASFTVGRSYPFYGYQLVLWSILIGASLILAIVSTATLRAALDGNLLRPE